MPGLSLVLGKQVPSWTLLSARRELLHGPADTVENVVQDAHLDAAFCGAHWYPRLHHVTSEATAFLEGAVYGLDDRDVAQSLNRIARSIARDQDPRDAVLSFVSRADGEYLAFAYSSRPVRLVVFNDRWGRLPAFWQSDTQRFALSREMKLLHYLRQNVEFSRLSLREYLLFGHVLGNRTLVNGIRLLAPATMMLVTYDDGAVSIRSSDTAAPDYREVAHHRMPDEYAAECAALLEASTRARIRQVESRSFHVVADLSGGFDSRAVCGVLHKLEAKVDFQTDALATGDESEYANRVAAVLGRPLRCYRPSHEMTLELMRHLAYMLDCMMDVFPSVPSYQDDIAHAVASGTAPIARFGGLGGGEFIKRIPRSKQGYGGIAGMVRAGHLVGTGKLQYVASLTGSSLKELEAHLRDYFGGYPETRLADQVRRLHYEYERKIVAAGVDRARRTCWPVHPLWSDDVMSYVFRIPERDIPHRRLAFALLEAIDARLVEVPVWNGTEIRHSPTAELRQSMSNVLVDVTRMLAYWSAGVSRLADSLREGASTRAASDSDEARSLVLRTLETSPLGGLFVSAEEVASSVKRASLYSLYRLLTPLLYADEVAVRHGSKILVGD